MQCGGINCRVFMLFYCALECLLVICTSLCQCLCNPCCACVVCVFTCYLGKQPRPILGVASFTFYAPPPPPFQTFLHDSTFNFIFPSICLIQYFLSFFYFPTSASYYSFFKDTTANLPPFDFALLAQEVYSTF